MVIQKLHYDFSICKVEYVSLVDLHAEFCFIGKTDEEISLVCITDHVPSNTIQQEDGWKAFRIQGILDFSMVGVLSKISNLFAEHNISIFAISTFHTDYILIKAENYENALCILKNAGYEIID